MAIHTFGANAVDWEERVDLARLRGERLARLRAELEKSELGALLSFDFTNIRYMTSTHIGTWAMDKLIRFALLPRGGEPVVWDFGSGRAEARAPRTAAVLRDPARPPEPLGVDVAEMPVLAALAQAGVRAVDGQ